MKYKTLIITAFTLFLTGCNFSFQPVNTKVDVSMKNGFKFNQYRNYLGYHDLPSVGNSKMLVIPVVFKDCSLSDEQLKVEHNRLEKTFFGTSEDTYWESVSSFYQKSSYNKLNIEGKVSDYFYYDKTVYQANKAYIDENKEPTYNILEDAISWYKSINNDIKDFDSDKDGFIDSVWLVYMEDYNDEYFKKNPSYSNVTNLSDFLWAFTFWDDNFVADINSPNPFSYAWGSYKFTYEGSSGKTDAHTFIHETGHLLGLDDYYNYDYSSRFGGDKTKPIGGLDMMDLNILDHNAYSKYLLGWIDPVVIGESCTFTLNSFQDTGNAIIVPTFTWNGSPLDEYLIIELYTPTGLNKLDSENSYTNRYPIGFNKNGVKIYHVDSRLGKYSYANNELKFIEYLKSPNDIVSLSRNYYMTIANSNTPSRSAIGENRLISLLSSTGNNKYFTNRLSNAANNNDLFKDGSSLNGYSFHQYNDSNLVISIDRMSSTSCEVTISGIGK